MIDQPEVENKDSSKQKQIAERVRQVDLVLDTNGKNINLFELIGKAANERRKREEKKDELEPSPPQPPQPNVVFLPKVTFTNAPKEPPMAPPNRVL